jgi:hypothetical protein
MILLSIVTLAFFVSWRQCHVLQEMATSPLHGVFVWCCVVFSREKIISITYFDGGTMRNKLPWLPSFLPFGYFDLVKMNYYLQQELHFLQNETPTHGEKDPPLVQSDVFSSLNMRYRSTGQTNIHFPDDSNTTISKENINSLLHHIH